MTDRQKETIVQSGYRTWFWSTRYDAMVAAELAAQEEVDLLTNGSVNLVQSARLLEHALKRALRESEVMALVGPLTLGVLFAVWSSFAGWCAAGISFGICILRFRLASMSLRSVERWRQQLRDTRVDRG